MSSVSTIAARTYQCAKMPSEAFNVFSAVVLVPVYQGCKHSLFLSPISVPCFLRCSWMCSWDDETNSWSSVGMCISACRGNSPSWMFLFKVNIKFTGSASLPFSSSLSYRVLERSKANKPKLNRSSGGLRKNAYVDNVYHSYLCSTSD